MKLCISRAQTGLALAFALTGCATTATEGPSAAAALPSAGYPAGAKQTLYDKYGGAPTVSKLVDTAITGLTHDCRIAPYFAVIGTKGHASVDRLKSCLVLQFSALMGGKDANGKLFTYPGRAASAADPAVSYDCQDMQSVHVETGIPGPVFDVFIGDLVAVSKSLGITDEDLKIIAPYVVSLKPQVVSATPANLDTTGCKSDEAGKVKLAPDTSLYAKYGGAPTVRKIVQDAVKVLLGDCRVAPYFAPVGTPGHDSVDRLAACVDLQISAALGGRQTGLDGNPLTDANGNPVLFSYPGPTPSFGSLTNPDGSPVVYRCQDMTSIHAYLGIPASVFDAFMEDIGTTLTNDGMSLDDVKGAGGAFTSLKSQVVSPTPTVLPPCTNAK